MNSVPPYLAENKARINGPDEQRLPPWNSAYDSYCSRPVVQRLYERCPDRLIQRRQVIELFAGDDPVLALVAALVWGGIATEGHRDNFSGVLGMGEPRLQEIIGATRALIEADRLREAFVNLEPGGCNKIKGVGHAYHTKLLFFLGQLQPHKPNRPLIFDRWTKNAFCALLCESGQPDLAHRFFAVGPTIAQVVSVEVRSNCVADAYVSYVEHMDRWANQLAVPASKIEEFLFGQDRRRDPSRSNPRNEILELIGRYTSTSQY